MSAASAAPRQGEPPEVRYLAGAELHAPDGAVTTLGAGGLLLGRSRGELYVVTAGLEPGVLAVRGDRVRRVWTHFYDYSATFYRLDRGARHIVEWNYTREGTTYVAVFDLRGRLVAAHTWPGYAELVDVSQGAVLLSGRKRTVRWVPGEPIEAVGPPAVFADPAFDLLMAISPDGQTVGPTSLAAPGTPVWSESFDPEAVSPDGVRIAGVTYQRHPKLQVRTLADGTLAPVPPLKLDLDPVVPGPSHVRLAREPDGDLLVVVHGRRGRAIVRCTMAGACERVTPWVRQPISFLS